MPSLSADASAQFWAAHPLKASPPTPEPQPLDKGKAIDSRPTLNPAAQEFSPSLDLTLDNQLTATLFRCFLRLGADVPVKTLEAEAIKVLTPYRDLHHWSEARTLSIKQQAIEQIMPHRKEYLRTVRAGHSHQAELQWALLNGPSQQRLPQGFVVGEVDELEAAARSYSEDSGYYSNEASGIGPAAQAATKVAAPTRSPIIEAPQPFRPDPLFLERILERALAGEDRLGALEPTARCESPSTWRVLPPIGFERQMVR